MFLFINSKKFDFEVMVSNMVALVQSTKRVKKSETFNAFTCLNKNVMRRKEKFEFYQRLLFIDDMYN